MCHAAAQSVCSCAVKAAIDMSACLIAIVTNSIAPVRTLAKYRPSQAVVVVTSSKAVARQCNLHWATVPLLMTRTDCDIKQVVDEVVAFARQQQLAEFQPGAWTSLLCTSNGFWHARASTMLRPVAGLNARPVA